MKRLFKTLAVAFVAGGAALTAQSSTELRFDAKADVLSLPAYGEVAGIATN